jgi:hypothetical protein
VRYPLSPDEQAAIGRHLADIRKQLQDVSDLFTNRYGKDSRIAERAVEAALSTTLLEQELLFKGEIASAQAQVESHRNDSLNQVL